MLNQYAIEPSCLEFEDYCQRDYEADDYNYSDEYSALPAAETTYNATYLAEHNRYSTLDIVSGRVNMIKAAKGVGKSTMFKNFLKNNKDKSILIVTHRRALNKSLADLLNISYYLDLIETSPEALKTCNRLCISPESLHHIDSTLFDIVVIDECEQVMSHITHSDTMKDRGLVSYSMLVCRYVRGADTVVLADADLGLCAEQLLKDAGINNPVYITNTYLPRKEAGDKFYHCKKADTVKVMFSADTNRAYGYSNEKRYAEFLAGLKENPLLVTSDTSADVNDIVVNINKTIHDYDSICCSPSMGTGVSIDAGHGINTGYGVFGATTTTASDCMQQIARVRDCGNHYCYIQPSSGNRPTTVEGVIDAFYTIPHSITASELNDRSSLVVDGYARMWAIVEANINKSRNDMRGETLRKAREEGFTIIEMNDDEAEYTELKEAKADAKALREAKKAARISELTENYCVLGNDAAIVAELEVKKKLISSGIKKVRMARMNRKAANNADLRERKQNVNHEISATQLTNHSLKRLTARAVYESAGIDIDNFTSHNKEWGLGCDNSFINDLIKKHGSSLYSQFGITCNAKSMEKPITWYNNLLAKFGILCSEKWVTSGNERGKVFCYRQEVLRLTQVIVSKGL